MLEPQLPAGGSQLDLDKVQHFQAPQGSFLMFERSKQRYLSFLSPQHLSCFSSLQRVALSFLGLVFKDSSVFCVDIPGLGGQERVFFEGLHALL